VSLLSALDVALDHGRIGLPVVRAKRHRMHECAFDAISDWIFDVTGKQLCATARAWTDDFVGHDAADVAGTSGTPAVWTFSRH
jgi:hypothetical protein